jgi:LemA protein
MELWMIVLIVIVAIIVIGAILIYNGLVQRRLRIDEAWAQIEVQLKRRHDLIPNLVSAVSGYMGFEQKVLTDVTNARAAAVAAGSQGPAQQAAAENVLTSTLRSLFAVVENYPELKANENVLSLQEQLTTTENQVSFARQHYNASVLDYNTAIATLPNALIAGPLGFGKREFFEAEPAADAVPAVSLGYTPPATSAPAPAPAAAPAAPSAPPTAPPPPPPAVPPAGPPSA